MIRKLARRVALANPIVYVIVAAIALVAAGLTLLAGMLP